jgi:demethylmenaquinone methyltransferase/2-methoxy-6-polyprenyl-1,4-benzoquinol methylase
VPRIDKALAEAHRVLKTGGRFLCLEFSACTVPLLDRAYDFHSFEVIPRLGGWAAGDADSYRYLVESIRKFPTQEPFAQMVGQAGFSRVSYRNLTQYGSRSFRLKILPLASRGNSSRNLMSFGTLKFASRLRR